MADLDRAPGADLGTETEGTDATSAAALPADLADERLLRGEAGLGGILRGFWQRLRGGELGSLPVVLGLAVIALFFYSQEPSFLSSRQLVSITQFAAPIGIIALGIVLVLLLGQIDLSVGTVCGSAAAIMTVLIVDNDQPVVVGLLAGIAFGTAVGLLYSFLFVRVGVPSFVITLAGLLGFQGLLFYILRVNGTINLPDHEGLTEFARYSFVSGAPAYVLVVVASLVYFGLQVLAGRRRAAAGLSSGSVTVAAVKAGLLCAVLVWFTYYLGIDRGWGYLWLLFVAMVVVMDFLLRRTRWGRHVYAVGGNVEAARRAGIKVGRIYTSVFVLCSTFASIGGMMLASQQTSVSKALGTTDTNLVAIAAAVIGGTSLFGGRGSAYSAMLGILVLQSIQSGLNLLGVDSSVRFMVTGGVLLLAVAIDSVSRKARSSSGRG